jgi:hypothetical protein
MDLTIGDSDLVPRVVVDLLKTYLAWTWYIKLII